MRAARDACHIAIPTHDLAEAVAFYVDGLGVKLARRYDDRVTFDFFGDQLVCHLDENIPAEVVPYPRHFGVTFADRVDFDRLLRLVELRKLRVLEGPVDPFRGDRRGAPPDLPRRPVEQRARVQVLRRPAADVLIRQHLSASRVVLCTLFALGAAAVAVQPAAARTFVAVRSSHHVTVGTLNRTWLEIAPSETPTSKTPIIVVLGGIQASTTQEVARDDLTPLVTAGKAELIYPTAIDESWNVNDGCCGQAGTRVVNDVGFISSLVNAVDPGDRRRSTSSASPTAAGSGTCSRATCRDCSRRSRSSSLSPSRGAR